MHCRDGAAHDYGATDLTPKHSLVFLPKVKRKPQRSEREDNRK